MASPTDQMEEIILRAYRLRKKISAVCRHAGISPSTWSRWQAGSVEPEQATIDKLLAALDEMEAQKKERPALRQAAAPDPGAMETNDAE